MQVGYKNNNSRPQDKTDYMSKIGHPEPNERLGVLYNRLSKVTTTCLTINARQEVIIIKVIFTEKQVHGFILERGKQSVDTREVMCRTMIHDGNK